MNSLEISKVKDGKRGQYWYYTRLERPSRGDIVIEIAMSKKH